MIKFFGTSTIEFGWFDHTDGGRGGREEREVPLPLRLRQGRPRLQGCQGRPLQVILGPKMSST